jgi:transposase
VGSSPQATVNNRAVREKNSCEKLLRRDYNGSGRIAPGGSRSYGPQLTKLNRSEPARLSAPALKSERTTAHEAPGIRLTDGSAAVCGKVKGTPMTEFKALKHFAGFDWAKDHHCVVVVNAHGEIVSEFEFKHSAEGWKEFVDQVAALAGLALAIETSSGPAVDQLLQRELTVFPVNPAASESYRQRKAPSGTKTDHHDAWALADALRIDGQRWKALSPADPASLQLRLLCKDEVTLIEQRTQLVNQLQQALLEYYPAALEAFEDWTLSFCWDFVIEFPTPEKLVKAKAHRWRKFLHTHHLWRPGTVEKRMEVFERATGFQGSAAVVRAKSQLAVSLCKLLRTLEQQLDEYRKQIQELFKSHPDHDLFGSLPGAGDVLAPRLMAAIGTDLKRYGNELSVLQAFAGTAPISYQSGQIHKARMRWACDKFMRSTVHLWAECFWKYSPWGQVYYRKKRQEGKSHACALRCLGGGRDKSGGYRLREPQKSSNRPDIMQQRRAIMALAPRTDQRIPDCLRRSPMTVRQPASTTPEPTKNFCSRNSA